MSQHARTHATPTARRPVSRRLRLVSAAVALALPSVAVAQSSYSWVMQAPQAARDWTEGWNVSPEGGPPFPQTPGDVVHFTSATAGVANSSLTVNVPNAVVGTLTVGRTLGTGTFLLQSLAPDNTNTLTFSNPLTGVGRLGTFGDSIGTTNITAAVVVASDTPTLRVSNNGFGGFQMTGPLTAIAPNAVLHVVHSNGINASGPGNFNINQPVGFSQIRIDPAVTWASIGTLNVSTPLTLSNGNVAAAVNTGVRGTFIRTDFTGSAALTVNNLGPAAQLQVTASGSYAGPITVNSGGFVLNHNSVNVGGNNNPKLAPTATVSLHAATLGLIGNAFAASNANVAAVHLGNGQNTLSVQRNGSADPTLTAAVLTRSPTGTLYFTRNSAAATVSFSAFGTHVAPANGLLGGWAVTSNTGVNSGQWDFLSASPTLAAATYVGFPAGSGTGTENVSISGNTVTSGASINALRVTGNATLTLNGNLNLSSGGILLAAPGFGSANLTITGAGAVTSSAGAFYFHQPPNPNGNVHTLTLNAPLDLGGGTLVKTGGGLLIVAAINSADGSRLALQGGTYRGPLPAQTGITLTNGAAIDTNGATALSFNLGSGPGQLDFGPGGGGFSGSGNPATVTLNGGNPLPASSVNHHLSFQTNSANQPLTFTNPVDVTGGLSVTVGAGNATGAFGRGYVRFAGGVSGDGSLAVSGSSGGMLVLETDNGFSGGVLLSGGQVWAISGRGIPASTPVQIGYGGIWATRGVMDRRLGTRLDEGEGGVRWLSESNPVGDAGNVGWGGFAAVGGPLTVALKDRDGNLATLAPVAGGLSSGSPASLHLGSAFSNAPVTVVNPLSSASATLDIRSFGPATNVIAGNISGGGNVVIAGNGTGSLLLTGDNAAHTGNLSFANAAGVVLRFASAQSAIGQSGSAAFLTINNNSTLDPNGVSLTSATPGVFRSIAFSNGSGVAGLGNLINSGTSVVNIHDVNLANAPTNLAFGGPGDIRVNGGVSGNHPVVKRGYGKLTFAGANTQTNTGMLLGGGSVVFDYTVSAASKFNGPVPASAGNAPGNLQLVAVDLNLVGGAASVTQPIGGLQLGQSSGNFLAQSAPSTLNVRAADGDVSVPISRLVRNDVQGAIDFSLSSTGTGTASVTIGAIPLNGVVSVLTLTNGGSGYTSAPTVSFSGGDPGTVNPQATAVIDGNGVVTQLILTKQGTALDPATPLTVTLTGGGGSGATATATVSPLPTIGNFATLNKRHFAAVSGGSGGSLVAPTYTTPQDGVGNALANIDVPAGTTSLSLPSVGTVANSLRFADGSADTSLTLTGGFLRLNPHAGGILVTPDVGSRDVTIDGQLRWNVNRDLFVYNHAQGTLTLSGTLNDASPGAGLNKIGVGDVVLDATLNAASLRVYGGRLIVRSHAALPAANLQLGGGTPELSGVDPTGRPVAPTLRYEGAGGNFGGSITLIGPARLDLAGAGELVFTGLGNNLTAQNDAPWDFTVTGASDLRFSGPVRMGSPTAVLPGYGTFTHASAGTTTLAGATNRALGGWVVSAGNLVLAHPSDTLQDDNPVTVSGGTLTLTGGSDKLGSLTLVSGTVAGTGTYKAGYYDLRSGTVTANLGGLLADLDKSGPGTVTLAGINTHGGHTTVTGGTLIVSGSLSNASPLTVSGGTLSVPASGSVNVRTYRQSNAELLLAGPLTVAQNATFADASTLTLDFLSDTSFGNLTAGGSVQIDSAVLNLTGLSNLSHASQFTLISAASVVGQFTLASPLPSGYSLTYSASALTLTTPAAPAAARWTFNGNGNYDDGGNWSTGTAPNAVSASAVFDLVATAPVVNVTLGSNVTLGNLSFNSPTGYTLRGTGPTLTLNNQATAAQITVSQGAQSIRVPVVLASAADITVAGGSSLRLFGGISGNGNLAIGGGGLVIISGAVTHTGGTQLNGGQTFFNDPVLTPSSPLSLAAGTYAEFAALPNLAGSDPRVVLHTSALTVGGTATQPALARLFYFGAEDNRTFVTQNLVITGSLSIANDGAPLGNRTYYGFLDLANNDLIVRSNAASHAGTLASVRDMVRYWQTAFEGLPGEAGLGSSAAFYGSNGFTTLAVFNNNPNGTGTPALTTFDGVEVSAYDVLVKYTYIGDTNLDGIVDASDLARALQGLNNAGSGWNFGDINYDGVVDFTDLGRILAALRGQGGSLGNSALPPSTNPIPEPAALALLAVFVPFASRRRRV